MDDFDWDEWMAMTDEQHDELLAIEAAKYEKWWNSLSTARQIAIRRRTVLEGCLTMRLAIKATGLSICTGFLKERQMSLVKIRAWRATGHFPGSA